MATPNSEFLGAARLVVRVLPHVATEACFALKGGTAINLFVHDMPRLSVDIDLVYLGSEPRQEALERISKALARVAARVRANIRGARIRDEGGAFPGVVDKFSVAHESFAIKVEVNHVFRQSVWPAELRKVGPTVERTLGFAEAQVASYEDLYGGKIAAALDRQNPRDLFDIKLLLETGGITDKLFRTFLVYLIGHNRTIAELVAPARKDVREIYEKGFVGMTSAAPPFDDLLAVRETLIGAIQSRITPDVKRFLLSVKRMEPEWRLLGLTGVEHLPAVQWKLRNLAKMTAERHAAACENLERVLDGIAAKR
ncbi:MAG: nucleotidyl transferase AbiEii/AbiGii toxin family protein [Burkholderiales bacterium]